MGPSSLSIPMSLFSENRQRLCQSLREEGATPSGSIIILQGGEQQCRYSSDTEIVFRQVCVCVCVCVCMVYLAVMLVHINSKESYFHWLFGVLEPDCFGAVEVCSTYCILVGE